MHLLPYKDRVQAGRELAARLEAFKGRSDVVVFALPRGGVPVGVEVARALAAPMDILVVRKLGVPGHVELAMGAIGMGGVRVLNSAVVQGLGITEPEIDAVAARESLELERRERSFRGNRPFPRVTGQCVIIVDDGLATGSTMRAAIAVVRQDRPAEVVVAVPVGPWQTLEDLQTEADDVICPAAPEPFFGVGQWYEHFEQLTDDDVRDLLDQIWQMPPSWRQAG